ncbi:hypothetical protein, partial [Sansalvadorimonas verongulae]|uniref:hypothetical protein n=1 Tax=Sansalvadorimonas verongulae TaxID=2172824 RepID=UPI001E39A6FD
FWSQTKGLSPVWMRLCLVRSPDEVNVLWHPSLSGERLAAPVKVADKGPVPCVDELVSGEMK